MEKAFFELSKSKVIELFNQLKEMDLKITYSLKTNPEVGKILEKETDSFFSVHTVEGLEDVKSFERVWLIAQAWNQDEIKSLIDKGITKFIVDNSADLNILKEFLKKNNARIDLLLRMKLKENTIFTGKYFVFGMNAKTVNEQIKELRKNKNIEKLGVHFHRKTQNVSEWNLVRELNDALSQETFQQIDLINIGGGLPVKYKNTSDKVLESIFKKINELKNFLNEKNIELWLEPGRFLAAQSVKLKTKIISIYDNNVIVNCSIYNTAMDSMLVSIRLLVEQEKEKGKDYTIKGSTPCSLDIFRYNVKLENPKIGEEITFLNAGAYNFSSDFCNLRKLETRIVD